MIVHTLHRIPHRQILSIFVGHIIVRGQFRDNKPARDLILPIPAASSKLLETANYASELPAVICIRTLLVLAVKPFLHISGTGHRPAVIVGEFVLTVNGPNTIHRHIDMIAFVVEYADARPPDLGLFPETLILEGLAHHLLHAPRRHTAAISEFERRLREIGTIVDVIVVVWILDHRQHGV